MMHVYPRCNECQQVFWKGEIVISLIAEKITLCSRICLHNYYMSVRSSSTNISHKKIKSNL